MSRKNKSGTKIVTWTLKGEKFTNWKGIPRFWNHLHTQVHTRLSQNRFVILRCMYSVWGSRGTCGIGTIIVTVRLRSAFILCTFNDCYLFNIQIKLFTLILLHSKSVCLKECVENVDCWVFDAQSVWNYFSTSLLVIIK